MFFFSNCHTCCHYLVHHLARIHRTLIVGRSTRFVSAICRGFDFSTLKKNQQQEEKEEEERKKKLVKLRLIAWILTLCWESSRRIDSLLLQAGFNEMKSIMLATIFHEKMKMKNYLVRRDWNGKMIEKNGKKIKESLSIEIN